jgi:hypothetical protein
MNDKNATPVKSLDQILEILGDDELRNIVGGLAVRPKSSTPEL